MHRLNFRIELKNYSDILVNNGPIVNVKTAFLIYN